MTKTNLIGGMFKSYSDYLCSPLWQEKRELILGTWPYKVPCKICRENLEEESRMATQVHHTNYDNICNEKAGDLIPVCSECHKELHKKEDKENGN